MATVDDLLLQLAYKRYDECNDERKGIVSNASIILALDGVLIGFIANMWDKIVSLWVLDAVMLLLASICLCLYLCIAQKFNAIDTIEIWKELANDETIVTESLFQQKIIVSIDAIEKKNTNKLQILWQYYNGAIGALLSALIMILVALL